MAYNILGKDDENLRITVTDAETPVINIQPASFTVTGGAAPVNSVNGLTGDVVLTTSEINEGTNLYYTDARVDAWLQSGNVTSIDFDNGAGGVINWNTDEGTMNVDYGNGVVLQVGQEQHVYAKTTTALQDGDIVMFAGSQGGHLLVSKADPGSPGFKPSYIIGMATQSGAINDFVYITSFGKVNGLDTSLYPEGTIIWMGTDGNWTTAEPASPAHKIEMAAVTRQHATQGQIFVRPTHMPDSDEVEEGQTNLYYTDARVQGVIDSNDLATVAYVDSQEHFDGLYTSLTGAPTLVSHFTNDAGYLTSYTETDPVFSASPAGTINSANINNWNDAWSWGNHATAGYVYGGEFYTHPMYNVTSTQITNWDTAYSWGDHATAGYLTSYTETDPVFTASPAGGITALDITQWTTAYSWGNHADAGYLTSYTETDPVFSASPSAGITAPDISNWNTAYSWGDHNGLYLSSVALNDVTDVILTTPTVGQVLTYDGALWYNAPAPVGYTDADVDTHLNTSTATDGQVLSYTAGDYAWVDAGAGGGASALNDLTDVTVTAPSDGDILRYNGVAGEFQNTNLGLSLTPTISYQSTQFKGSPSTVTITNWGDYDDPNAWAQVLDSSDNVIVSPSQVTDNNDGTVTIPGIDTAGTGYKLQVKVQDFGDLASDTVEQVFDVEQLFGWTTRYIKIADFTTNTDPNDLIYSDIRFYTGAAQTGTALPAEMTSDIAPAPFVITSSDTGYSADYAPWKAFDNNTSTQFWTLGASSSVADTWIVIDLGAEYTINSMRIRTGGFASDVSNGFTLYTSDTGAFAGEEVQRETLSHSDATLTFTYFN